MTSSPRRGGHRSPPSNHLSRRGFLGMLGGAAAVGIAGPSLLAACSSTSSAGKVAERHQDGILRIGVASAPSNINPLDSGSEVTRWIAEPVVESLYTYDDQLRSVPLLAAGEPTISADQLTWTIPLRRDVRWHNGDLLVADDVVATLGHLLNLSAGSEWITYMIGYVQTFEKVDDHTVRIDMARPYGLMRSHLTNLPIVHRDYVNRKDAMMGTGPYRLDGYVPGQTFTMSRFADFHGAPGSFAGIEFSVFTDGATRLVSLRQGKVDLITSVPYHSLGTVEADDELDLLVADAPLDVLTYVLMQREPFSDPHFRQAVAVSMDRAGVRERVYGGHATDGQGPIGPAELGYDPSLAVFDATPDIAKARELLDRAATTKRSFRVTIGTGQTIKDIAQVLAAGWEKVGLTVEIEQLAGGPWSNKWLSRDYDMLMNTFQSGFTSGPANYLTLAPASSTNVLTCGYRNPEVDTLLDVVWGTADEAERVAALGQIDRRLAEDAVIFPPVYPQLALAQRKELSPVDANQLRISRIAPQTLHFVG